MVNLYSATCRILLRMTGSHYHLRKDLIFTLHNFIFRVVAILNDLRRRDPQKHYLSFSKTSGLRVTEIKLESRKQLIETEGQVEFKLAPLFEGHKLDIENAILEFESF